MSGVGVAARRARLEAALGAAQRALRSLEAAGWGVEALDARLIAGRAALELGRTRLARRQLELAAEARYRGPVQVRTRAWHAAALLRLSRGDRRGAGAAIAAGLRALEAHRMTLGASELRAHASGHGEELATLGLRLAVASGSAARVLAAAERHRAASLLQRPARPPDEPELAADLEELRRVTAELDEALREGRPRPDLARRQAALEQAIRRRALRARGETPEGAAAGATRAGGTPGARGAGGTASASGADRAGGAAGVDGAGDDRLPSWGEIAAAFKERSLIQLVVLDGRLLAVSVVQGRARPHELGAAEPIEKEVSSLRFALRSVASGREKMTRVVGAVAERLDGLLFSGIDLGDRPLVLVPTGALHAVPWSLLPRLAERPLAVAPSLRLWWRASRMGPRGARSVYVAGPRLPAAREEIEALRLRHPEATTLMDGEATIAAVARAIDGADHAHLAAHGRFRDDNPLFTSLELADGNVTVYDLERLERAPRQLILASCETGLSAVHAGDELMGFTAAVFALGTQTVIAAVVPVPDAATKGLMLRLDEELSRGSSPAAALVKARTGGPIATSAFVCFGAG
jgi:CHAT domain-containing protein